MRELTGVLSEVLLQYNAKYLYALLLLSCEGNVEWSYWEGYKVTWIVSLWSYLSLQALYTAFSIPFYQPRLRSPYCGARPLACLTWQASSDGWWDAGSLCNATLRPGYPNNKTQDAGNPLQIALLGSSHYALVLGKTIRFSKWAKPQGSPPFSTSFRILSPLPPTPPRPTS